jgi:hypothetical protein
MAQSRAWVRHRLGHGASSTKGGGEATGGRQQRQSQANTQKRHCRVDIIGAPGLSSIQVGLQRTEVPGRNA